MRVGIVGEGVVSPEGVDLAGVGEAQQICQVLPALLHAYSAHERHAALKTAIVIFYFET